MTLDRRIAWGLFALLFVSYAYFCHGGGWNENSRFDLTRAIVEQHTLSIDEYASNTGDKAFFRGHFYSDKAPGLSFAAVPVYAAVLLLRPLFSSEHAFVVIASWIVTALTVGVAGAATAVLLYRAARMFGAQPTGSLITALAYGLGTNAFPLSTMLFGHQLATLTLFAAFFVATSSEERSMRRSAFVAALAATSVLVEFPVAPAALAIVLYDSGLKLTRRTLVVAAAVAVPALALFVYLGNAFGSPLRVGYELLSNTASRDEMTQTRGFVAFGLSYPKMSVAVELLLGRYRGLLVYSPILLLAIPGFLRVLAGRTDLQRSLDGRHRNALKLALGVVIYFVLFVSSYEWWQGGASFGSRHLSPMLPFLALPVAFVVDSRPAVGSVFAAVSVVFMTIVTSVQPKPSERYKDPFWEYELPAFLRGDIAASNACPMFGSSLPADHPDLLRGRKRDAFNVGILLGASGPKSLVPLITLWLTSAWAFRRTLREAPPRP